MNDKETQFIDIVADTLEVQPHLIDANTKFTDIGADSLDFMELVLFTEEEFDCEIADEVAEKMVTVQDFFNYIKENDL